MSEIQVRIDPRGQAHIAWVTISNEHKLNTLTTPLIEDFRTAIERLSSDQLLRAVIVTGAGTKAFIGGADINEMSQLDAATAAPFITRLHLCCQALRELPVPVIARIHGYALGAGLELAAACDLRVATDTSIFGMPEVKLGIPSVIEAALLPPLVGWGRAREILLLGENFGASQAQAWGLIEKVVTPADLDAVVEQWIASILKTGPNALRIQKKLIRAWEDLPLSQAIHAGIAAFKESWESEEPSRMMREFLASRR